MNNVDVVAAWMGEVWGGLKAGVNLCRYLHTFAPKRKAPRTMPQPYKVFTIYAREDAQYLKELRGQLRPLEIGGRIKVWSDSEIDPGVDWEKEIVQNLDTADIILILVSAAYYSSAYIHEKEIKYAILRHEKGEAKVLPIIVRPCSFGDDPVISRLQVLPTDGKPVNDRRHWQERDDAWVDVVDGVKRTLDLMLEAERMRKQEILDAEKRREEDALAAQHEAERKILVAKQEKEEKEHAQKAEKAEHERLEKEQVAEAKRTKEEREEAGRLALQQKFDEEKQEKAERIAREKETERLERERLAREKAEQERLEETARQEWLVQETPLPVQRLYDKDRLEELRQQQDSAYYHTDFEAWGKTIEANDIEAYKTYLAYFPQGNGVRVARYRIKALKKQIATPVTWVHYVVSGGAAVLLLLAVWLVPRMFGGRDWVTQSPPLPTVDSTNLNGKYKVSQFENKPQKIDSQLIKNIARPKEGDSSKTNYSLKKPVKTKPIGTSSTPTKTGVVIIPTKGPGSGRWAVRVGTFPYMEGARKRLEEVIKAGYPNAEISRTKEGKAAVIVFRSNDKNAAIRVCDQLEEKGIDAAVFDRN